MLRAMLRLLRRPGRAGSRAGARRIYVNGMLTVLALGIRSRALYFEAALLIGCSASWVRPRLPSSCCAAR